MIQFDLKYDVDFLGQSYKQASKDVLQQIKQEISDEASGYYNLPYESQDLIDEVQAYGKAFKHIDTIAVIGIGGSSLGTKAIYEFLRHKTKSAKKIIFFENPDPIDISEKFMTIDKNSTQFLLISKSGSTVEPMSIFKAIIYNFNLEIDNNKNIIAITDHDSALYKFAHKHNIKTFTLKDNVGGRFSVLSSVGIVPLTLAGFDTKKILDGAREILESFLNGDTKHILDKAVHLAQNKGKHPINVIFSYSNTLKEFTQWYVQLWAESLGKIDKDSKHTGLTPVGHIGAVDQHSFLQLIIEGPRDKTVTFIKIDNFENPLDIPKYTLDYIQKSDYINGHTFNELINAECDATMQSVHEQGINVDIITLDKISEENIGELIMYYELLTSAVGIMLNINTYNQEGVELGKRILVKKFQN